MYAMQAAIQMARLTVLTALHFCNKTSGFEPLISGWQVLNALQPGVNSILSDHGLAGMHELRILQASQFQHKLS